jgi:SOS-response transcriptional repressor LexA
MKDMVEIRRAQLRKWFSTHPRPEAEKSYISQLLKDGSSFGERAARRLEATYSMGYGYLDAKSSSNERVEQTSADYSAALAHDVSRRCPLISWVKAGELCEAIDNLHPGDAEAWFPCGVSCGENTYVLKVIGSSMEKEYFEGEMIFVDPGVEAKHGSDVVVRTPEGNTTFKRLQITAEGTYLMALNKDYPERIIKVPEGTTICGVVVFSGRDRRK